MSNILEACLTLANDPIIELTEHYSGRNRINSMGTALEVFIEDIFADTVHEHDERIRQEKLSQVYSYSGNQNNPPDRILRNGDAIEVKKIQSVNAALALNSSYPKAKLFSNSPMITEACRHCENPDWHEKDIIYAIGHVSDNSIKSLWMIYGDCYAAEETTYKRIKNAISQGVLDIPDIAFSKTKELGKIKHVDPLGITDLRIRGMWHIENPKKVFDYLAKPDTNSLFELFVIMKENKYKNFPQKSRDNIESSDLLKIYSERIKNPNNPVDLLDIKFIHFSMGYKS